MFLKLFLDLGTGQGTWKTVMGRMDIVLIIKSLPLAGCPQVEDPGREPVKA